VTVLTDDVSDPEGAVKQYGRLS